MAYLTRDGQNQLEKLYAAGIDRPINILQREGFVKDLIERRCHHCHLVSTRNYPRSKGSTNVWICVHCADLDQGYSGRVHFRDGYQRDGNPRAQPEKYRTDTASLNCVHCMAPTRNRFQDAWDMLIAACGWGHAGLYIDKQIDAHFDDNPIDIDYVYRSLGVTE